MLEQVSKRMGIVFQTIEPLFWRVAVAFLQPGLNADFAGGGGFGAL